MGRPASPSSDPPLERPVRTGCGRSQGRLRRPRGAVRDDQSAVHCDAGKSHWTFRVRCLRKAEDDPVQQSCIHGFSGQGRLPREGRCIARVFRLFPVDPVVAGLDPEGDPMVSLFILPHLVDSLLDEYAFCNRVNVVVVAGIARCPATGGRDQHGGKEHGQDVTRS